MDKIQSNSFMWIEILLSSYGLTEDARNRPISEMKTRNYTSLLENSE